MSARMSVSLMRNILPIFGGACFRLRSTRASRDSCSPMACRRFAIAEPAGGPVCTFIKKQQCAAGPVRAPSAFFALQFAVDVRAKTHRGLTGQIERGYHAGGLSNGK